MGSTYTPENTVSNIVLSPFALLTFPGYSSVHHVLETRVDQLLHEAYVDVLF